MGVNMRPSYRLPWLRQGFDSKPEVWHLPSASVKLHRLLSVLDIFVLRFKNIYCPNAAGKTCLNRGTQDGTAWQGEPEARHSVRPNLTPQPTLRRVLGQDPKR